MGKRIISRRRGSGGIYSAPSHQYKADIKYIHADNISGVVESLIHDPGHSSPIAKLVLRDGRNTFIIANEGLRVHQEIFIGENSRMENGNILPLKAITEGIRIFNIEGTPGDGGKFVRSAGSSASIISKGERIVVRLPSGQMKHLLPNCKATIGIVAGGGRKDKPWAKAGKKYHAMRSKARVWPIVSGVAMNPVDHPHGGGGHQHVGKTSSLSHGTPPGRKVGHIAPKRTGRRK